MIEGHLYLYLFFLISHLKFKIDCIKYIFIPKNSCRCWKYWWKIGLEKHLYITYKTERHYINILLYWNSSNDVNKVCFCFYNSSQVKDYHIHLSTNKTVFYFSLTGLNFIFIFEIHLLKINKFYMIIFYSININPNTNNSFKLFKWINIE